MTDTTTMFSRPHAWIHWIMAALILMMLVFGQGFSPDMPEADHIFSLTGHSSLGSLVVILLVIRITTRLTGASGRPTHDIAQWQASASKAVQLAIYALLIYVPVTGILTARVHPLPVRPFGAVNIATPDLAAYEMLRPLHDYGTKALMLLLVLHIGAGLMHKFVLRDGVMRSMNPFAKRG